MKYIMTSAVLVLAAAIIFLPITVASQTGDNTPSLETPTTAGDNKPVVLYPDFWGLDLTQSFPDWRGSIVVLEGVFEDQDGRLIVRFGVGVGDGSTLQQWNVDPIRKRKTRIEDSDSTKYKKIWLLGDPATPGNSAQGSIHIILNERTSGGTAEPCADPMRTTFELQRQEGKGQYPLSTAIKSIMIIMETHSQNGYEIGGHCDAHGYVELRRVKTYAESVGNPLFPLPDQTSFVQAGDGKNQSALLLRFDRDLNVRFKSDHFQIINTADYEALLEQRGFFGAQTFLLSELK